MGSSIKRAAFTLLFTSIGTHAATPADIEERLDQLAKQNESLKERVAQLEEAGPSPADKKPAKSEQGIVHTNHSYSYDILDPTTNITRRQELILSQKKESGIGSNALYLSGAVTPIADYQKSNTESKFGYLMRHPTENNQRTKTVSEAVIHSAQIALTATVGDWVTTYVEILYDPQQSFGSGTLTDLNRNQVQVRRGYVLLGDLEATPVYASLGKMDVPFGLMDTVNPFTASTVWHAFGGLAYGLNTGIKTDSFSLRLMGIQGGAQFRAANVPVDNSNVPSKLNNYAADISYTFPLGESSHWLIGSSYIKGSPYCQGFPVVHFEACEEENGAYDIYTQLHIGNWEVQGEYAKTQDEWPGTFNPTIPEFDASKVTSWDLGTRYTTALGGKKSQFSLEFSRFVAGPDGAEWEKQDQWVLGFASFVTPSAKLFVEAIRTEGYAPLNFISGGNLGPGATHSVADAHSNILMIGANVAY
ncbi:hypothetical protein NBRC116494_00780 [Aurantivibrio plasticivorans]